MEAEEDPRAPCKCEKGFLRIWPEGISDVPRSTESTDTNRTIEGSPPLPPPIARLLLSPLFGTVWRPVDSELAFCVDDLVPGRVPESRESVTYPTALC